MLMVVSFECDVTLIIICNFKYYEKSCEICNVCSTVEIKNHQTNAYPESYFES